MDIVLPLGLLHIVAYFNMYQNGNQLLFDVTKDYKLIRPLLQL